MKKKLISLLLAATLMCGATSFVVSARDFDNNVISANEVSEDSQAMPTLTISSHQVKPGSIFEVNLDISNNTGICGFCIDLYYSEVFEIVSYTNHSVLSSPLHNSNLKSNPYKMTWDDSLASNSNNGTIVTVKFKVAEDAPEGEYSIYAEPLYNGYGIIDFMLKPVKFDFVPGKIAVSNNITEPKEDVIEIEDDFSEKITIEKDENLGETVVEGIQENSDVNTVLSYFKNASSDSNTTLLVLDLKGNQIEGEQLVGTGSTVQLVQDGVVVDEVVVVIKGDINGDGKIALTDVTLLRRKLVSWDIEIIGNCADIDGNGTLAAVDATKLRRQISGFNA